LQLRIALVASAYYIAAMKTLTVKIPEPLAASIDAEARLRNISKSDVVRERLERAPVDPESDPLADIRDLIGSVDGGPSDLSARKKHYLRAWGFGRNRSPR
jgi:hypothetical protein